MKNFKNNLWISEDLCAVLLLSVCYVASLTVLVLFAWESAIILFVF